MRCRTLGALALGLLALAAVVGLSGEATATGAQIDVIGENATVVQGHSTTMHVTFGVNQETQDVHVTCDQPPPWDGNSECPVWTATIEFDPEKGSCYFEDNRRVCDVDFPSAGFEAGNRDKEASQAGEPSKAGTWHVGVEPERDDDDSAKDAEDMDSFEVVLSTTQTCYDGYHRRGENMAVAASGVSAGSTIRVEIVDQTRQEVVYEAERSSSGEHFTYTFPWGPALDYPLGSGGTSSFQILLEKPGGMETESFTLRPGMARGVNLFGPGLFDEPDEFDRTESVLYEIGYIFPARPPNCTLPPGGSVTPVSSDQVNEPVRGEVYKVSDPLTGQTRELIDEIPFVTFEEQDEFVEAPDGTFMETWTRVVFNWTIPRDLEATRDGSGDPQYELRLPQTDLADGNLLEDASTPLFEVHPYTLTPEFAKIQKDVERLETAELVVNLTYEDGSPFTANDTEQDDLEVEFGPADDDLYVLDLEHLKGSRWNASVDLEFDHEPLGQYTWRVREAEDRHGRQDARNTIERTVSPIVNVVGARPIIDFETHVGDQPANSTQRSQTVHVSLNAKFKNGEPLTSENVDPSLGGVQLNVKKTNPFGRIIDVDSHVMTPASDDGDWVRSFHVGKSATDAPIGTWELEVVARDDKDPVNENVTGFDFSVEPADIQISPREIPPTLVDEDVESVHYRFQLTYPDGTHVTERLVDDDHGGSLNVQLERIRGLGQDPAIEEVIQPRSRAGGQFWEVTVDSDRLVTGNHYFNVTGEDIHGNTIGPESSRLFTVLFQGELRNSTTPICPPGSGVCDIERGSDVFAVFPGSQGDTGIETEEPEILLLRQPRGSQQWLVHANDIRVSAEEFHNRTGTESVEENHVGLFETSESTPMGTYRFYISGRASDDTGFAGFSERFNITPVTTTREIVEPLPATAEKGEMMSAAIERNSGDVITEIRAEAGRVTSRAVQTTPSGERMFLSWTPPRLTPSGPASIHLEGRDVFGNSFETTLGPVDIRPMDIDAHIASHPQTEVQRGFSASVEAELTFQDGTTMTSTHGEPEVIIRNAEGERIDEGRSLFAQERWQLHWRPTPDLPTGRYVMEITGQDDAGNQIETTETRPFQVVPGRVSADVVSQPSQVRRGDVVTAVFEVETDLEEANATLTTGTDDLGPATVERPGNGTLVTRFPTDRSTTLARAFFQLEGEDVHGNRLVGETEEIQINPMQLTVSFVTTPSLEESVEDPIVAEFVVEYPDGTRMHAGQGSPLVGLFRAGEPQGLIDSVEPRPDNPTVWRIEWEPPDDIVTDVPYTFGASAIDAYQNEGAPETTRGFFLTNPMIPDYMPVPGPGLASLLAGLVLAAGLGLVHRRDP